MKTVDELLQFIVRSNFTTPFDKIESKDKKILISLYKHVNDTIFLTERQGYLLLRTLNFYQEQFDIDARIVLQSQKWSKPFRLLESTKKISLVEGKDKIKIEFSYDKTIKKKLLLLMSQIKGNYELQSPTLMTTDLNEKNVLLLIDNLKSENFVISQELLQIYEKIQLIFDASKDILDANINFNDIFKEKILSDINMNEHLLDVKILDRRLRYQYKFELPDTSNELFFRIANRDSTNLYASSTIYKINDLLDNLNVLERLPVLIVLDSRNEPQCLEFINFLKDYKIHGTKGVYFRLNNNCEENRSFNEVIKNNSLNSYLDDETSIAVISNTTLPKFFIKSNWRARSVISLTNSFRNNKAHVFCNNIDLKIYYGNTAPMIKDLYEIL